MEQQEQVQELIRLSDAGQLDGGQLDGGRADGDRVVNPSVIDLALIESLKKEVDTCIRSDARQALKRADLAYRLSRPPAERVAAVELLRQQADGYAEQRVQVHPKRRYHSSESQKSRNSERHSVLVSYGGATVLR